MSVRLTVRPILLAMLLAAAPALAQTDTQATPPAKPQTPRGKQIASQVEQHIAELHKRLHITAAEQPQWDGFAQTMRGNAAHTDQLFKTRMDTPSMSALDDLRSYASIAQAHADDVQRLVPPFQALYEAMSPDQRKSADAAFKEFEQRGAWRAGH
jgi:periplasmic protein CpxP/Spy